MLTRYTFQIKYSQTRHLRAAQCSCNSISIHNSLSLSVWQKKKTGSYLIKNSRGDTHTQTTPKKGWNITGISFQYFLISFCAVIKGTCRETTPPKGDCNMHINVGKKGSQSLEQIGPLLHLLSTSSSFLQQIRESRQVILHSLLW